MLSRRGAMRALGFGSLFGGVTAATASAAPAGSSAPAIESLKGIIVVYLDVGQLPPFKAEAFVAKTQERMGPCPQGWQRYVIPIRPHSGPTRIEVFTGDRMEEAKKIVAGLPGLSEKASIEQWNNLRRDTEEYVRVSLGEPVKTLGLDRAVFLKCWQHSVSWLDRLMMSHQGRSVYHLSCPPSYELKQLTLGHVQVTLGRRDKSSPDSSYAITLGRELVREAKDHARDKWCVEPATA